jgi:hypothetical protein
MVSLGHSWPHIKITHNEQHTTHHIDKMWCGGVEIKFTATKVRSTSTSPNHALHVLFCNTCMSFRCDALLCMNGLALLFPAVMSESLFLNCGRGGESVC